MATNIVIGNWKLNPDASKEAKKLFLGISKLASKMKRTQVVVAPPFVYTSLCQTKSKKLALGAQDVFWAEQGAYTGEISVTQLKDLGVKFVIIGHSERRALGESNEMINRKVRATLNAKLTPILCIGESAHDQQGAYLAFLSNEIRAGLKGVSKSELSKIIIAYEPIWAIGKRQADAMTPRQLHETVLYIQKILSETFGRDVSKKVRIIYGGSVGGQNAGDLMEHGQINGFLVGGASLSVETFAPILKAVDSI